jgi:tRNA(fMet)-specific endonuclease VapC
VSRPGSSARADSGCSANAAALDEFLSRFELLDYPVQAGSHYGKLRADLERAGIQIGGNDLMIAAHALTIGARLATANVGEFNRVPGLRALNWLA